MKDLLPCPFCGGEAEFERMGTPRQSCIVACTDCGGRLESSEEGAGCGSEWNDRHAPDGWKVVPVKPTREMLASYEKASIAPIGPLSVRGYTHMLTAVPKPGGGDD